MKTIIIVYVVVLVLGCCGYIANIVKLCRCDFEPSYKSEAIRITGIVVPPVGAVAGFCTIADK